MRQIDVVKDESDKVAIAALRALTKEDSLFVVSENDDGFCIAATPYASAILATVHGALTQRQLLRVNRLAQLVQKIVVTCMDLAMEVSKDMQEPPAIPQARLVPIDMAFIGGIAMGLMVEMHEMADPSESSHAKERALHAGMHVARQAHEIMTAMSSGGMPESDFFREGSGDAVARALADLALGKAAKA